MMILDHGFRYLIYEVKSSPAANIVPGFPVFNLKRILAL